MNNKSLTYLSSFGNGITETTVSTFKLLVYFPHPSAHKKKHFIKVYFLNSKQIEWKITVHVDSDRNGCPHPPHALRVSEEQVKGQHYWLDSWLCPLLYSLVKQVDSSRPHSRALR